MPNFGIEYENYLFVYGSLRKGLVNSYKLDDSIFIGECKTHNEYIMIGLKSKSYPYIFQTSSDLIIKPNQITGELYKIDKKKLDELDILEGHPKEYKRQKIKLINLENSIPKYAYAYFLENSKTLAEIKKNIGKKFVIVDNGDWKKFVVND